MSASRDSGTKNASPINSPTVTSSRRSGGTSNTALAWTTPITSSTSVPSTGKRDVPVATERRANSAAVASPERAMMSVRGVRTSATVFSPKRNTRVMSPTCSLASVPSAADAATRLWSSARDRTLDSSSAGSMPKRRTARLAAPTNNRITGAINDE